jgi:hypothetical protein
VFKALVELGDQRLAANGLSLPLAALTEPLLSVMTAGAEGPFKFKIPIPYPR